MKTLIPLILIVLLIGVPGTLAQHYEKPGGGKGPITPEEIAKRETINTNARALLDTFVGKYTGTLTLNDEEHTVSMTVNPSFVQGHYHPGYYKVKDSEGNIVYESATMFTYNIGGMAYLFFYFGSDNFIRTYVGNYSGDAILVRTPLPQGIEFLRFSKVDSDTLKQEKWKPVPNAGANPQGEPDEVLLLKRVR